MAELTPFELATLNQLDHNRVGLAVNRLIKQAIQDCLDRPGDDRARKVTLQINLTPISQTLDNSISCEGAKAVAQAKLSLPNYETQVLDLGVKQGGHAYFSAESPTNHRQATFFDGEEGAA